MRKLFLAVITALLLSFLQPVYALPSRKLYVKTISDITGYDIPTEIYPKREDMYAVISELFYHDSISANKVLELPFSDINDLSEKALAYVETAYSKGVFSGIERHGKLYGGILENISRQDAITMLGRVLGEVSDYNLEFFDSSDISPYALRHVSWFLEQGIISLGNGYFDPRGIISGEELSELAFKAYEYKARRERNIETFAGTGIGALKNGKRLEAAFLMPQGVVAGDDGFYVFDTYNNTIRKIEKEKVYTLTTVSKALNEERLPMGYYKGGSFAKAFMNKPVSGSFNSKGELIVADSGNHRIRLVSNDKITSLAGGKAGYSHNNFPLFNNPTAIDIDENDIIYIADTLNNCIRKIDKDGAVITIAGSPQKEGLKDGTASTALFRAPSGIAVKDGVVYVSDTGNHRIRKIENGIVTTIAGFTNETDEDGDLLGGFADGFSLETRFNLPMGIVFSGSTLIVADSGNNKIRAVTKEGLVYTIAGNGDPGDEEGSAAGAVLSRPSGVDVKDGVIYIADTGNNKIKTIFFEEISGEVGQ